MEKACSLALWSVLVCRIAIITDNSKGDGVTEDEEGMVPDDATVAYISTLDGSREERAFELAKHDYYGFLDYKEDRYTTVYGYMD